MTVRSLKRMVLDYCTERRLTENEAETVFNRLRLDSRCRFLEERWDELESTFEPQTVRLVTIVLRNKVLTWMDRFAPAHSARALFTGAS